MKIKYDWLAFSCFCVLALLSVYLVWRVGSESQRADLAEARVFQERYYAEQRCGMFILNNSVIENGQVVFRMPLFVNESNPTAASGGMKTSG